MNIRMSTGPAPIWSACWPGRTRRGCGRSATTGKAFTSFKGASPANVAAFERDYPAGQRLELGVNYRSRVADRGDVRPRGGEHGAELYGVAGAPGLRGRQARFRR